MMNNQALGANSPNLPFSNSVEKTRKKLTASSSRKKILIDSNVARGQVLVNEVRPGFTASGFDLEYLVDTTLEVEEEPSLFCGVLTSETPAKVSISNIGEVDIKPLCPVLISFGPGSSCIGEHRAGVREIGAGCRISPDCLKKFAEEYEASTFKSLVWMLESGNNFRQLPQSSRLVALVYTMLENPYDEELGTIFLEGCMLSFIAEVGLIVSGERDRAYESGLTKKEYDRAHEVRQILEENIASPPSLSELSKKVGINSTTMSNQFRNVFGVTIFKYVGDRRLEIAKALLRSKVLPVSQVGYRVGFNNPGAFATAYRRKFGYSPSIEVCNGA